MDKKREEALYKHGFRLLEEQLATYIKEHYEGVSRIEFSPIFEDGGDGYSMYTLNVVVAISDEHGNRALVDEYGSGNTPFGTANGLTMDFDGGDGSQVIELDNYDRDEVIDVSDADTLPKNAKLESYRILDEMIQYLVKTEQLVDVKKSNHGSRDVKVVYNTTIKKGSYSKWH
ncbi:hypothetical protein ACVR0S_09845 [Streptococcus dentapri]|uniref:Uncharacterized protein n=1 Tax=Streptococcus dentapri TaxID=573564 RepID=A0ABV8CZY6_9STRE